MNRLLTLLTAMLGTLASLTAGDVERPLEYKAGDVLCEGWHAYDDAATGRDSWFQMEQFLKAALGR